MLAKARYFPKGYDRLGSVSPASFSARRPTFLSNSSSCFCSWGESSSKTRFRSAVCILNSGTNMARPFGVRETVRTRRSDSLSTRLTSPFFIQSIHSYAYRAWIEVDYRADRVDWQWTLVQEDAKNSEIRIPQALLEDGRKKVIRDRLPCFQQDDPSMDRFRCLDSFHKNLNPTQYSPHQVYRHR